MDRTWLGPVEGEEVEGNAGKTHMGKAWDQEGPTAHTREGGR